MMQGFAAQQLRQCFKLLRNGFKAIAPVIESADDDGDGAPSDFRPSEIMGFGAGASGGGAGLAHPLFKDAAGMDGDPKLNANVRHNPEANENHRDALEEQLQLKHAARPKSTPKIAPRPM